MTKVLTKISKLILLLATILLSTEIYSQENSVPLKEKAVYGVKAGLNFAELWGEHALPESDRKVGYSIGVYGTYKISKNLKLQPEVIWSLQGENSEKSGRYKISYINIPLMLKWAEGSFYYELGPQLGLLTISTTESVPEELKLKNFETFDFSLNAGFGYQVAEDWAIGLRYSQGISNIVSNRDLKNSVIYVGLAYQLF